MAILEVEDLKMYYTTPRGYVKAVDGVSFELREREALGLAGESGCGKTSLAYALLRLLPRNAKVVGGRITVDGVDILRTAEDELRREVRWKKISMIPQAAMSALDPVFRIVDQMVEAIVAHEEVGKGEARERGLKLLKMVGIDPFRADRYPHEFSGGMKQRVMIAMALASKPKIVIADEPTTALDVVTQAQVMKLLKELQRELGLSLILISHDLALVGENCDRVAIMYAGHIAECASSQAIFSSPLHPYTQGLLGSLPSVKGPKLRLRSVPGSPPDLLSPPSGCRFHPRCPFAKSVCKEEIPLLLEGKRGHYAACHMVNEHPGYG